MTTAIVTGASSGIGLHTAQRFIQAGATVINLSRRPCPIPQVQHIPCDLSSADLTNQLTQQLAEPLANADQICLVHNAARLSNDSARDLTAEDFRNVLEVNLVAPSRLNQVVMPQMSAGSSILYIGSTLSEKAVPNSFSYVTSKHASIGMMRATVQDLAGLNIHTACICPGFTDTQMMREHVPAEAMADITSLSAFNRLVEPDEIADTVYWASISPVINGSIIHANLGQIER